MVVGVWFNFFILKDIWGKYLLEVKNSLYLINLDWAVLIANFILNNNFF